MAKRNLIAIGADVFISLCPGEPEATATVTNFDAARGTMVMTISAARLSIQAVPPQPDRPRGAQWKAERRGRGRR